MVHSSHINLSFKSRQIIKAVITYNFVCENGILMQMYHNVPSQIFYVKKMLRHYNRLTKT